MTNEDETKSSRLSWLVGLKVNLAVVGSDGRPRFESGTVLSIDSDFIRLRNNGEFLIALDSVVKIELPNCGRTMTPDKPPWRCD